MGILFSLFINKVFGKSISSDTAISIVKFLFVALLVAAIAAAAYVGYRDYKALITENATLKEQVASVTKDLKEQIKANEQLAKSNQTDITYVDKNNTDHATADVKNTVAVTKKHEKIAQIEKKHAAEPQTPETQAQEEQEISTAQIDSIWEVYCGASSLHPDPTACGVSQATPEPPVTETKPGEQT